MQEELDFQRRTIIIDNTEKQVQQRNEFSCLVEGKNNMDNMTGWWMEESTIEQSLDIRVFCALDATDPVLKVLVYGIIPTLEMK